MKKHFLNVADGQLPNSNEKKELFLLTFRNALDRDCISLEQKELLITLYRDFYVSVFDRKRPIVKRVQIFHETLLDVINIMVKSKMKKDDVLSINENLQLINSLTFFMDQLRINRFSEKAIKNYLRYAENSEYFKLNLLYFYRVNRVFIENNYDIHLDDMNSKELYYGITTGYLEYEEYFSLSYLRLIKLCKEKMMSLNEMDSALWDPMHVVFRLKKDGFITDLDEALKMVSCEDNRYALIAPYIGVDESLGKW